MASSSSIHCPVALFALHGEAHGGRGSKRNAKRQGRGSKRHAQRRHAHWQAHLHVAALLQGWWRRCVKSFWRYLLHLALQAVGLDQPMLARVGPVALATPPPPIVVLACACSLAVTAVVAPPLVLAHVCRALPAQHHSTQATRPALSRQHADYRSCIHPADASTQHHKHRIIVAERTQAAAVGCYRSRGGSKNCKIASACRVFKNSIPYYYLLLLLLLHYCNTSNTCKIASACHGCRCLTRNSLCKTYQPAAQSTNPVSHGHVLHQKAAKKLINPAIPAQPVREASKRSASDKQARHLLMRPWGQPLHSWQSWRRLPCWHHWRDPALQSLQFCRLFPCGHPVHSMHVALGLL